MDTRSWVRRRRIGAAVIACAASALALAACSSSSSKSATDGSSAATSASASTAVAMTAQQACDTAATQDGGTLNYWTSTDASVFTQEVKAFNAKYPNIHVKYTSLEPVDMVQRIVAEKQAGHSLDVDLVAGDLPSFATLFDQKLIQTVDWAKLGVPQDTIFTLQGIPTPRTYREVLGLGYNTKLVQPGDLPSTWEGLVNSKWAGKVVVDPRGSYLSGLALAMGQSQAITFFTNLLKTDKPQIVQGATASMTKIISGEAELTTSSHDSETAEQQAKNAPVAIKYLDIVPTEDWYAQILKGAAHTAAAECFESWWTGPDGQAQQLKYEFKSNATTPAGLPAGAKLEAINTPAQAAVATSTAAAFAKLMAQ
jgi:iron(III) transport system substrate-binding protein